MSRYWISFKARNRNSVGVVCFVLDCRLYLFFSKSGPGVAVFGCCPQSYPEQAKIRDGEDVHRTIKILGDKNRNRPHKPISYAK